MSTKILEIAGRIHRNVETALWAAVFAFAAYFTIFVLPKLPEIQAEYARVRATEVAAENAWLCETLDVKRGSDGYNQCLLDVGQFRWKVEQRAYTETAPW